MNIAAMLQPGKTCPHCSLCVFHTKYYEIIGKNMHILCGCILVGILLNSIRMKLFDTKSNMKVSGKNTNIFVEGMTCSHCEESIQKTLMKLSGVSSVIANSKTGQVIIQGDTFSDKEVNKEINELGFKVKVE